MIAVIGAGASGVLTAVHVVRRSTTAKIALLDAGARAARGLAYGTPYGAHLLNVPAARMSALADEPDHFVRWLQAKLPDATPATFAPRPLYGDYLASVLAAHESPRLSRISGSAVGLTRDGAGKWSVHLHDGRIVDADTVVLALGNLPPADPFPQESHALNYVRDPWAPGAGQGLATDAPVLLIGSGLTMIDLALALRHEGHRGTIHVISRRGLLPRSHAAYTPMQLERLEGSPRAVLRSIRRAIESATDWRAVIDALRPHTQTIWQSWTLAQRASFLRHARTMWDVHRHRTAPAVAAEINALIDSGALVLHRGRIQSLADGIVATWSHAGEQSELRVARAINCTGPASNYANVDLPLVLNMRRAGWLIPDPLGLGIESSADGRIVGSDGRPVDGLFTIGPLRRPAIWESTAIPEIRAQADALAAVLTAT
jgi:uncharacterized NAD(P)/FAD-binding protein YdhS